MKVTPRFMIPSSKFRSNRTDFRRLSRLPLWKVNRSFAPRTSSFAPYHSACTEALPKWAERNRGLAVSFGAGRRVVFGTCLFLAALLKRHAQVQISDQPVQVVRMYPQQLGRFCEVSAGLLDSIEDELLFQFADGLVVASRRIAPGAARFQDNFRQVFGQNEFRRTRHNRPLDGVFELAHIARPVVAHQARYSFGRDSLDVPFAALAVLGREVPGQQRNIFPALTQG